MASAKAFAFLQAEKTAILRAEKLRHFAGGKTPPLRYLHRWEPMFAFAFEGALSE